MPSAASKRNKKKREEVLNSSHGAAPNSTSSPASSSSSSSSIISSISSNLGYCSVGVESGSRSVVSVPVGYAPPHLRANGIFPGNTGTPCKLAVNHVRMKVPAGKIYQYNLKMVPPWKREFKKSDKDIYQVVIQEWRSVCPVARHCPYTWVYNGDRTLYCTQPYTNIPDSLIKITYEDEELEFHVIDVKMDSIININQDLVDWAMKGQSGMIPQSSLQALNVILSQSRILNHNFISIGNTFFRKDGHVIDLGFGKEVWTGIFLSTRPNSHWENGEKFLATLNVDVANKPAIKSMPLIEKNRTYIDEILDRKAGNWREGMTKEQTDILARDLKGLKVKYELPSGCKREYRCNGVKDPAESLVIPDLKKTVKQYFKEQYGVSLKHPNLPCLWLGATTKTIFIPLEFCHVMSQALPSNKSMPERANADMIRQTAQRPWQRQKQILDDLKANNAMYKDDKFAKEFNISMAGSLVQLTGRILNPPSIDYQGQKTVAIDPKSPGSWRQTKQFSYVNAMALNNWAVLDLSNMDGRSEYELLLRELGKIASQVGMKIQSVAGRNVIYQKGRDNYVRQDFQGILDSFKQKKIKPQLILVVLPFKGGKNYNTIKRLGDLEHKIPTQCCVKKNLFKNGTVNGQVLSNLCMKINSKLQGTNHKLSIHTRPKILSKPVMVLGADVTHAAAQFKGLKPSIAAVVGSVDPTAQMKYEVEIRVQEADQNEEMILDMKKITTSLLKKFYKESKQKPESLIMFRDGVSEGQFVSVMARELREIRAACDGLPGDYRPRITYLVVQKRHHTRFFPADDNKYQKSGNALAGTVVDHGINHPTEGDFYLLSHEGIQGTSRPCHYQVLWDDNGMSAGELEQLAYYLCHLYARCTKSVSYPAPTYYSHLAADRARKHHDHMIDNEKMSKEQAKQKLETSNANLMYFV